MISAPLDIQPVFSVLNDFLTNFYPSKKDLYNPHHSISISIYENRAKTNNEFPQLTKYIDVK